ncbi:MAG TPA: hypothetical protein VKT73_07895 [Xanthobacteraceae bacterium]|nr:hypothetical protein [Xanthobacteraceae bacterium]
MAKPVLWWQKFGNAAQIASAVVAAFGFGAVLFQINEIRNNSRAASARQTYLGYLDLAFKNPTFSEPDYGKIKAAGKEELIRYETFVNYFLYACEEAMLLLDTRGEWRESCEYDLKYHLPFLCEKNAADPRYLSTYNEKTRELVKSAMQRYGVVAPECKLMRS